MPMPPSSPDVTGLLRLVGRTLQGAGVAFTPRDDLGGLLQELALVSASSGVKMSEPERSLCRMALREAHLLLTSRSTRSDAAEVVRGAYEWMGGDASHLGRGAGWPARPSPCEPGGAGKQ